MEGLRLMGLDEEAVVVEIGTAYTKCGYSGEALPRSVVKTPSALSNPELSESEFYDALRDFLNIIYFHKVQSRPKEGATVLCENLMASRKLLEAAVKVMFEDFQVPILYLVMENSLPVYTSGGYTGLVVDSGFTDARVLPIFEGIPIVNSYQSMDCGLKKVLECMKTKLELDNDQAVEDILVKMAKVSFGELRKELQERKGDRDYYVVPKGSGTRVKVSLRQRFTPEEVMFGNYDSNQHNIAAGVLKSLLKCDIDTRKGLINNIILCGGGSMIPGFQERFEEELLNLLDDEDFSKLKGLKDFMRVVESPYPRNLLNWIGGSVFGCLPRLEWFAVSRESYLEKGLSDKLGSFYLHCDRPSIQELFSQEKAKHIT